MYIVDLANIPRGIFGIRECGTDNEFSELTCVGGAEGGARDIPRGIFHALDLKCGLTHQSVIRSFLFGAYSSLAAQKLFLSALARDADGGYSLLVK
jgi:hypothetical protein